MTGRKPRYSPVNTMIDTIRWFLETAEQPPTEHRGWLVVAVFVLLMVLRHLVIALLSHSEKRR